MPWWTWAALVFFLAVFLAATAALAVLGLRTLRALAAAQRSLTDAATALAVTLAELERRLAATNERVAEAERRLGAAGQSYEKLTTLAWALADARDAVGRVRRAVPRK